MHLLDTDLLVGFLRNNPQALHKIKSLVEKREQLYTSVINLHELVVGAYLSKDIENNLDKIRLLIQSLNILLYDENVAYLSGKIYAQRVKIGKMIEQIDVLIASLALANNLILITKNIKHFENIEGLQIETW